MRNRQWYLGLALTAALVATLPAGAQQTQQQQKQTKKSATPFDPCTGSGLPATSQTLPGLPGNVDPQKPKKISGGITCSNGKCKPTTKNKYEQQQEMNPNSGSSLPLSPGATKAGNKNESKEENSFPLAKSEAAQKKANPVNAPAPSAADENPFPQGKSEAAQAAAQKAQNQPPSQQGVYSSSNQRLPSMNALGNGPAMQGGEETHPRLDPELGKKDDKVGKFYLQSGDWAGAYGRYKQATQVNPGDIKAVIGLAIAADHLGKRDVAIQNYKLYLTVLPDGPHSKEALKALKRLDKNR